ncbi:MAG: hypothetical protein VR65_24690 [Desulfobulbaceae bacterium BRH_c16a]|nr:MAG: hypothetical protein VR65_24690 [Desulfobulbaceae bacterium BRH_c16a]
MLSQPLLLDINDAWKNLCRRPLRSLLSSLGIGIGVTALIAMLSISEGAKLVAFRKISSMGINTLRVEALPSRSQRSDSSINLSQGLNHEDGVQLEQWLGTRGKVGAYARKDNVLVRAGNKTVAATVLGVNAGWFGAEKLTVEQGRLIDDGDIAYRGNSCVIGSSLASALQIDILSTIQLAHYPSTVVGLAARRGRLLTEGTGLSALDFDNTVIVPLSSMPFAKSIAGRVLLDGLVISLEVTQEGAILSIAEQIKQLLARNHRNVDDFNIVVPVTLLREAWESQRVFSFIMGAIAGLSLLVGGIGVMNVMLANISEQTREIGLRMAVGASRARIISLYLWNSILLTLSGGLWGTLAGVLLALGIENVAGWEVVFSTFSLIIAPLSAILTGIIFGLHPARRAAALDPALALRDS